MDADAGLPPEIAALRRTAREFADRELRPRVEEMEAQERIADDVIALMGEVGFLRRAVPGRVGRRRARPDRLRDRPRGAVARARLDGARDRRLERPHGPADRALRQRRAARALAAAARHRRGRRLLLPDRAGRRQRRARAAHDRARRRRRLRARRREGLRHQRRPRRRLPRLRQDRAGARARGHLAVRGRGRHARPRGRAP